ncbi:hypothetical protein Tco_1459705, partial [Tanacetum coccineum]
EYQDTVGSKGKKVMDALSFYMMETDEINERYIAPCFVNGLEAYDGEINFEFDENLISNEFARRELYFVKFIINPKEDDVEPEVILGRSFLRLAKGVVNFDDWDQLLDFNFDGVPKFEEELLSFVCKMGKSNCNKKRAMENLNLFYQDIGTSSSAGDTTTLREVIDLEGRLIPEDLQPGVPRVGIPRPPRSSIQDLYDRMVHMEIRQETIERMVYR